MVQPEQVTNLVSERGFEIVRAGRAVSGKLKLSSVFGARSWIDTDVCFGDVACFGIEEDARATGGRFGVERFVFGSDGDRQQTNSVACFCGTDGSRRGPRDEEVDIRETGPACKRAACSADDVAIRFDVRAGREQRRRERDLDGLLRPANFANSLGGRFELERVADLEPLSGAER